MKGWKRAMAMAPALAAALGGCARIGNWTRDAAGLNQSPVRTEYDNGRPAEGLYRAGFDARRRLTDSIQNLVSPAAAGDESARAREVFQRAEEFYHIGRLAMRSQCESFMQTLASVDGQTTFGRDLANNFFDTATVAATISNSPTIWATGLSATQNSFNSISGSTERFLLLTESVGALRERVILRMEAEEGEPPPFADHKGDDGQPDDTVTGAVALDIARQSLEAVQRYGAPCTEAGIRLIIAEALSGDGLARDASRARDRSYTDGIRAIINANTPEGQAAYAVTDDDLRLLYVWALIGENPASEEDRTIIRNVETRLPYLRSLKGGEQDRLSYLVQRLADQRPAFSRELEATRASLLEPPASEGETGDAPANTPTEGEPAEPAPEGEVPEKTPAPETPTTP